MTKEYNKAYKEVLEVLKYMLQEEREKIPQKMIQMFKEKMDSNHKFKYDESKKFDEQELLIETKAILSNLFRDYWATSEQRDRILSKQNRDRIKIEEQKKEKYNPDNIFKKRNQENEIEENIIQNEVALVEYKESIFRRFINKIKSIFRIS